jgi:hypothetical protein
VAAWLSVVPLAGSQSGRTLGGVRWIREGGQLYGEGWHLQSDPSAGQASGGLRIAASGGLRIAACGATFGPAALVDEWPSGDAPSQGRRCLACQGAYASIEGQLPRGAVPHG